MKLFFFAIDFPVLKIENLTNYFTSVFKCINFFCDVFYGNWITIAKYVLPNEGCEVKIFLN